MKILSWNTTNNIHIFSSYTKGCNCFVIIENNKAILFDTSKKKESKKLLHQINYILNTNKATLNAIVLSHDHFDHAGNSAFLSKYYDCPILIHKSEYDEFCNGKTLFPIGQKKPLKLFTKVMNKIISRFENLNMLSFPKCNVKSIVTVEDNFKLIQYGINATIIHTPGHTKGSISIIINNEFALVGSSIVHLTKNQIFPPMANLPNLVIPSINKILNTNCFLIFPAHGKVMTADFVKSKLKK